MCYLETKKADLKSQLSLIVQAERLELSHLAALDPKSSVSTNSTTPATFQFNWAANINNSSKLQSSSLLFFTFEVEIKNIFHEYNTILYKRKQTTFFR